MKVLMKVLAMWLSVAAPVVVAAAIVVLSTSVVGNVMAQSQEEVWFSDLVVEDFTSGDLEYLGYWEGSEEFPAFGGLNRTQFDFRGQRHTVSGVFWYSLEGFAIVVRPALPVRAKPSGDDVVVVGDAVMTLVADGARLTFEASTVFTPSNGGGTYVWFAATDTLPGADWTPGQVVRVALTAESEPGPVPALPLLGVLALAGALVAAGRRRMLHSSSARAERDGCSRG